MPTTQPPALVTITEVTELAALPVGSVVLDSDRRYGPIPSAWSKSDDTDLRDDLGERAHYAWASIVWKDDRSDEQLLSDHGPLRVLWRPDEDPL